LTLVELLIVLAIIGALTAVAVPAFLTVNRVNSGNLDQAGRELQAVLRAAKIYASTYSTDTAVAYSATHRTDSITGEEIQVIDGFAMVRRLRSEELEVIAGAQRGADVYTAVISPEGAFRRLANDTCLALMAPRHSGLQLYSLDNDAGQNQPDAAENMGLRGIRVVELDDDGNGGLVALEVDPRSREAFPMRSNNFPAHIFTGGGILQTASAKQRFQLYVTHMPDMPTDVRYLQSDEEPDGVVDVQILQLYATLGRIKMET
jgi:type II secretory pathway pseudopilin PulG